MTCEKFKWRQRVTGRTLGKFIKHKVLGWGYHLGVEHLSSLYQVLSLTPTLCVMSKEQSSKAM